MARVRGFLKYGDLFFMSVDSTQSLGIDPKSESELLFVSAESIDSASSRLSSNDKNVSHLEGIVGKDGEYPLDFFTSWYDHRMINLRLLT